MKNKIRKEALEKRKYLNADECGKKILQKIYSLNEYKNCKNIMCYHPLKNEVNIIKCLNDKSKNWFLPRVSGDELEVCPYEENRIEIGYYNIKEPTTKKVSPDIIDMIFIPAVAADKNGYRIGYGKGFYDRFLPKLKKDCIKLIAIYSELLYETIFPDKYDKKADIVVTDIEIINNLM